MAPNDNVVTVFSDSEDDNEVGCGNEDCEYHYPKDVEIIMEVNNGHVREDRNFTPEEDECLKNGLQQFGTNFESILNCSWYTFHQERSAASLFHRAIVLKLIHLVNDE